MPNRLAACRSPASPARAWAAGAGPSNGALVIGADSTICEDYGKAKQGATYGYSRRLGDHPLLAIHAHTGEVLHARQRTGKANTARGAPRFVDETMGRVRRTGATGELIFKTDSGFWSATVLARQRARDTRFSITVRQTKPVRAAIAAIVRPPGSTSATAIPVSRRWPRPRSAATGSLSLRSC